MTSAVAAVADPSVACALALPAEDVASSVAAPARAREVGWAQRAANVLFGAPSARPVSYTHLDVYKRQL